MLRSLIRLLDVNPGFAAREVLTFQVDLGGNANQYAKQTDRRQFYERFATSIETLPGVRAAGAVSRLPLNEGNGNISSALTIEGRPMASGDLPSIDYRIASASYFDAMRIPLLSGRIASVRNPDEVNINQTAVQRFFPVENPIGRRVKFGPNASQQSWKTVVGIVGDVHHLGLEISPRPEAYRPYIANPLGSPVFAVRSTGDLDTLTGAIRARLRALDPQLPMFNVYPMEQLLDRSLESRRFSVLLLSLFAGIALLLAAIGLYGLLSYAVGMRTHEIGIRVALGAESSALVRMVVAQGLRLAAAGLAIGLGAAIAIGPLFANLVFGVSSRDPIALLGGGAILFTIALAACWIPARRAAKLDPVAALRA